MRTLSTSCLQATSLSARIAELEAELDSARSEARSFGSMAASKERDAHRRLEGLQDELEHAHEQVTVQLSEKKRLPNTLGLCSAGNISE